MQITTSSGFLPFGRTRSGRSRTGDRTTRKFIGLLERSKRDALDDKARGKRPESASLTDVAGRAKGGELIMPALALDPAARRRARVTGNNIATIYDRKLNEARDEIAQQRKKIERLRTSSDEVSWIAEDLRLKKRGAEDRLAEVETEKEAVCRSAREETERLKESVAGEVAKAEAALRARQQERPDELGAASWGSCELGELQAGRAAERRGESSRRAEKNWWRAVCGLSQLWSAT